MNRMVDYDVNVLAALRRDLTVTLEGTGWVPYELDGTMRDSTDQRVAQCVLSLGSGFDALAVFDYAHDEGKVLAVGGVIAIVHTRSRELLDRLVGSTVAGVALAASYVEANVEGAARATAVARKLAAMTAEYPREALEDIADVDVLIPMLHEHEGIPYDGSALELICMDPRHEEHAEAQVVLALLAGTRRFDDARVAIREYSRVGFDGAWAPQEYRRVVRQVERVIRAGGDMRMPRTPPSWPPGDGGPHRGGSRSAAGARAGEGLLLAAEVWRRGLQRIRRENREGSDARQGPVGGASAPSDNEKLTDNCCDMLNPQLKLVGADRQLPERAAYPILPWSFDRLAVTLRPESEARLCRIADGRLATLVKVWFTWPPDRSSASRSLDVYIGSTHIGYVGRTVAERFRLAMDAAADRDEYPWTHAQLSRIGRTASYILEIPDLRD